MRFVAGRWSAASEVTARLQADRNVVAANASPSKLLCRAGFTYKKQLMASECARAYVAEWRRVWINRRQPRMQDGSQKKRRNSLMPLSLPLRVGTIRCWQRSIFCVSASGGSSGLICFASSLKLRLLRGLLVMFCAGVFSLVDFELLFFIFMQSINA